MITSSCSRGFRFQMTVAGGGSPSKYVLVIFTWLLQLAVGRHSRAGEGTADTASSHISSMLQKTNLR